MTELWFVILLGAMLAIIILLTCCMVGYARKKYLIGKQTVMNGCRSSTLPPSSSSLEPKQMMKQPGSGNNNGFWCDPETTLWRTSQGQGTRTFGKGQESMASIPDYGPIDCNPYQDTRSMKRNAFGYKEFGPASITEYAEVSSFRKGPPSEYGRTQSPAPYATTRVDHDGQLNTKFAAHYEQRMPAMSLINPDLIMQHQRTRPECAYYVQQEQQRNERPTYSGAGSIHSELYYNPMERHYERECHNNLRNLSMGPVKCSTFTPGEHVRTMQNPRHFHHHHQSQEQQQQHQPQHRFKITPNFPAMTLNNFDDCRRKHESNVQEQPEQLYVKVGESNAEDDVGQINWNLSTRMQEGDYHRFAENKEIGHADLGAELLPPPMSSSSLGESSGLTSTVLGLIKRSGEETPQPV